MRRLTQFCRDGNRTKVPNAVLCQYTGLRRVRPLRVKPYPEFNSCIDLVHVRQRPMHLEHLVPPVLALGALGPVRRERADAVSVSVCVVRHADRRELRCAPAERDELDDEDHEDGDERDRKCVRLYGRGQRPVGQLKAGART